MHHIVLFCVMLTKLLLKHKKFLCLHQLHYTSILVKVGHVITCNFWSNAIFSHLIYNGFHKRSCIVCVIKCRGKRVHQWSAKGVELARVKCYLTHHCYQVADVFLPNNEIVNKFKIWHPKCEIT